MTGNSLSVWDCGSRYRYDLRRLRQSVSHGTHVVGKHATIERSYYRLIAIKCIYFLQP